MAKPETVLGWGVEGVVDGVIFSPSEGWSSGHSEGLQALIQRMAAENRLLT